MNLIKCLDDVLNLNKNMLKESDFSDICITSRNTASWPKTIMAKK